MTPTCLAGFRKGTTQTSDEKSVICVDVED
jgi:hypothetical protein